MDCIPQFRAMQECFKKYPEEYSKFNDDEEEGGEEEGVGGEGKDGGSGDALGEELADDGKPGLH